MKINFTITVMLQSIKYTSDKSKCGDILSNNFFVTSQRGKGVEEGDARAR